MGILSNNPNCSKQEIVEFVEEMGINKEKLEEILMIAENVISLTSLNTFIGEDEDSELGDFTIDDISPTVEEQVEFSILREMLDRVLDTLKPREKDIIAQRYGLDDGVEKTLEQISVKYNVTRERIRQIEVKALRKLRHLSGHKN